MSELNIVLGVGGGIAAYKAALLLRLFTEAGHQVTVIPTDASTNFVGVATWEALSGRPVTNNVFDAVDQVNHVRIGHEADLIVVAPATADLLAKAIKGYLFVEFIIYDRTGSPYINADAVQVMAELI